MTHADLLVARKFVIDFHAN